MALWSLYWRLVGARARAQMQYKASFWLGFFGVTVITLLDFAGLAILLARFPSVGGWGLAEVALLYGQSALALSLARVIGRGFDRSVETLIQRGGFDMVLTRPLGSFFQILATDVILRQLGRALQGGAVLAYALAALPIAWTPAKVLLLPLTLLSGTLIYFGLLVLRATLCFWTVKSLEVVNILTYGGDYLASYPLSIYNDWIRNFFLFVIPIAFVNYPAALFLLDRRDPHGLPAWLCWAAPPVAVLFLTLSYRVWLFGVSKYQSTGS